MLLEEFEDVAAVIEPTEKPVQTRVRCAKPLSCPLMEKFLKRLTESEEAYPGGYLKSINGQHPVFIQGPIS